MVAKSARKGRNVPEDGQRQPQEEDKLEGEVEGEPVNDVDKALSNAVSSRLAPIVRQGTKNTDVKKAKTTQY